MNNTYKKLLETVLAGKEVTRRGKLTKEVTGNTSVWDSKYPVITIKERGLNYAFMAAEALWILRGHSLIEGIGDTCKSWTQYSDDGIRMQGAYGPMFVEQYRYVVETLKEDPMSRQAVISIWRPNPRPSKDIPCTLNLHFLYDGSTLDLYVNMRSSDVYLGIPYDVFTFSMMLQFICTLTGMYPGCVFIHANSQHIYSVHESKAWDTIHYSETVEIPWPTKFKSHTEIFTRLQNLIYDSAIN